MLLAVIVALTITAIVVAAIARLDMTKVGLRRLEKGEPDLVLGATVAVLSVGLMLVTARYSRPDAPASTRIMLNSYAVAGLLWGLSQVLGARRWARRRKRPAKILGDNISPQ